MPATDASRQRIRILFLGANPEGTGPLSLTEEVRAITRRLEAAPHYERIELIQEWAIRVDDLQAALLRHRPHILHFSGHGRPRSSTAPAGDAHRDVEVPVDDRAIGGEIVVADPQGAPVALAGDVLRELLELVGGVRCVVLNACYSADQSAALSAQVDCVIGMSHAIPDRTAITFAWAFYQALAYGESVAAAFRLAKNQLRAEGLPGAELPRLLSRSGVDAARVRLVSALRPPHGWLRVAAVTLGVGAALVVGAVLAGRMRRPASASRGPADVRARLVSERAPVATSTRLVDVTLENRSDVQVIVPRARGWSCVREGSLSSIAQGVRLDPIASYVIEIPYGRDCDSGVVDSIDVELHPAIVMPPRNESGPSLVTIQLQLQLMDEHHATFDWDVMYSIGFVDEVGGPIPVLERCAWRSPSCAAARPEKSP